MKTKLKQIAAGSIAALVILIFLSSTIYNHNLPSVTAVMPVRGHLNQVELTTGIVRFADTIELTSALSGTVSAVLVREGEEVRAGQPVIEMDFAGADEELETNIQTANLQMAEQLSTIGINRQRTQVDLQRADSNISNITRQIAEAQADLAASPITDFELRQTLTDIERAETELARTAELFEAGIATAQEVRSLEDALETLSDRLAHQEQQYQNQQTDRQENLQRQISSLEHQLDLSRQDRQSRALDLEALLLQEETLRRETAQRAADYQSLLEELAESTVLTAPIDGVITSVSVNQGQHISMGARLISFGRNLELICEIPLSNSFVVPGISAALHNSSHSLTGTVTVVNPTESSKRVTIAFESDEVSAGETFTIQFESTGAEAFVLVPNSAINRDGEGYFLNRVGRRQGIVGTEFYTERLPIYIGDSDSEHTAVLRGITFFEPVTVLADRPFSPGQTVRLRNEGDFFE